jgi:hypothetical protein
MRPSPFSSKRRSPSPTLADNANHELIAYYADYAKQPAKALHLAEQELRAAMTSSPSTRMPGLWRHPATMPRPNPKSSALWPSASKIPSCLTTPASSRLGGMFARLPMAI